MNRTTGRQSRQSSVLSCELRAESWELWVGARLPHPERQTEEKLSGLLSATGPYVNVDFVLYAPLRS